MGKNIIMLVIGIILIIIGIMIDDDFMNLIPLTVGGYLVGYYGAETYDKYV